ncbi:hypothetical protein SM0020_01190 [Sinorhizobium meliloti CCNWSX0020]|uniref:N-acetylmuramoyl-L-alanine amidase domain-containing protein n=2 Tax=Rhizobium meliloti TaxID=382 RepID=H0FSX3_RHIML|nr:hypothetical protein SM0020_01190 [Sinorhizobium meliloti CCNWSX0020]
MGLILLQLQEVSMTKLTAVTASLLVASVGAAFADDHVEVRYGNVYVNIYVPGTIEDEGVGPAIYGSTGLIAGILAGAIKRPPAAEAINVTLMITSGVAEETRDGSDEPVEANQVVASVLRPPGHPLADQVVTIDASADSIAAQFCDLILDTDCENTEVLNDFGVAVPREDALASDDSGAEVTGRLPNVNFGSPGSVSDSSYFLIPPAKVDGTLADDVPLPEQFDDSLFNRVTIQEAINNRVDAGAAGDANQSEITLDEPEAEPPVLGDPKHWFVVHCTAFSATDAAVAKAVARIRAEGRKNKAYSWLDSTGKELKAVSDLKDPRELATRTESTPYCPSIAGQAKPRYINLEVHYACSDQSNAAPTSAQYRAIPQFYKRAAAEYGPMHVTSHRHVDRGIKGAHSDPAPRTFSFDRLKSEFIAAGISVENVFFLSSAQQALPAWTEHKHFFPPDRNVALHKGPDDCR